MPTKLDRIQTLMQPVAYAKVRTIAKERNLALSAMAAEMLDAALEMPEYQALLEEALTKVPARPDPRLGVEEADGYVAHRRRVAPEVVTTNWWEEV